MKTAIAINHKGVSLTFNPTFEKGDTETRSFAENSKAVLNKKGITIAFDSVVTKEAVIEARRFLDSINVETFQSTLPLTDTEKAALYLDWFNNYTTLQHFAHCKGYTRQQASDLIAEGRRIHEASVKREREQKTYTVITVSTNTNSFGYKSLLCLAEDGEGVELLVQAYGTDKVPVRGETVHRGESRFYGAPRKLPTITPASAKKIIAEAKA